MGQKPGARPEHMLPGRALLTLRSRSVYQGRNPP
jgi:hypothetical protein